MGSVNSILYLIIFQINNLTRYHHIMRNLLTFLLLAISINVWGQTSECTIALERDVFETYKFKDRSSFKSAIKLTTEMSYEKLESLVKEGKGGGDAGLLWGLISASGSGESKKERFEQIKKYYRNDFNFEASSQSDIEIIQRVASKTAYDAWLTCVTLNIKKYITYSVVHQCTDCDKCDNTFDLSLKYSKVTGNDKKKISISYVSLEGAKFSGTVNIKRGSSVTELDPIFQKFTKESVSKPVRLIIGFKNMDPAIINIPSCNKKFDETVKPHTFYTYELTNNYDIKDDEDFGPHDYCKNSSTANVELQVGQPQDVKFSQCCGGEVRLDYRLTLLVNEARELTIVNGIVELFEGTSCHRTPRKKHEDIGYYKFPLSGGEILNRRLDIKSGDYGAIKVAARVLTSRP